MKLQIEEYGITRLQKFGNKYLRHKKQIGQRL